MSYQTMKQASKLFTGRQTDEAIIDSVGARAVNCPTIQSHNLISHINPLSYWIPNNLQNFQINYPNLSCGHETIYKVLLSSLTQLVHWPFMRSSSILTRNKS